MNSYQVSELALHLLNAHSGRAGRPLEDNIVPINKLLEKWHDLRPLPNYITTVQEAQDLVSLVATYLEIGLAMVGHPTQDIGTTLLSTKEG